MVLFFKMIATHNECDGSQYHRAKLVELYVKFIHHIKGRFCALKKLLALGDILDFPGYIHVLYFSSHR